MAAKGIANWPVWKKEASTFSWFYDRDEYCYILEGEANIKTDYEEVAIKKGDFVKFPQGLNCVWTISKAIKKHYTSE